MPLKTLIEFGLSEKEATIYLALLELAVAGASEIADKTKINRSSVYVVLDSLKGMGLVTSTDNTNPDNLVTVQEFSATSPDALLKFAKERAQHGQTIETKIEALIPELKALHKDTKHKPQVAVYTGRKALELHSYGLFYEQTTRGMKTFRFYGDLAILIDAKLIAAEYSIKDQVAALQKTNSRMRAISPKTPGAEAAVKEYLKHGAGEKTPIAEFKLVETKTFYKNEHPSLSIYEDKVAFFSDDLTLVVIENKEIVDSLKSMFDAGWQE